MEKSLYSSCYAELSGFILSLYQKWDSNPDAMASARKLPSGNWRIQVFVGKDENGRSVMKSFTAPTRKEAKKLAAGI